MTELITKSKTLPIERIINIQECENKQGDCKTLISLMKEISTEEPQLWGSSIIGFGKYHYKYDSGREGDWFIMGFSPRKQNISIYLPLGFKDFDLQISRLGKYKLGKSCIYIKSLADIDMKMLKKILVLAYQANK
jgi:hypothetical protein